jgi:tRNA (cytidine/uridine-2'-O-)-methyltransferase
MFHVVLYQPEIPPNTGNIMRLCANTGAHLHLIGPLGFRLEDKELRRAGLDYREWVDVRTYASYGAFLESAKPRRLLAFTTRARRFYTEMQYRENDALLSGPKRVDCHRTCSTLSRRNTACGCRSCPGIAA